MLILIFLHQIKEPEDFKLWHETMVTEFPERFQRLLAGPMWSGLDPQDISLRKQPSFFAPGPSGVSREGHLRFTAKNSILMM